MSRPLDSIRLREVECRARIGVSDAERSEPQRLLIHAELELDLEAAGHADQLDLTLDYTRVVRYLRQETASSRFQLVEALAGHLLQGLMEMPRVESVKLEIEKFPADLRDQLGSVSVCVSRTRRPD